MRILILSLLFGASFKNLVAVLTELSVARTLYFARSVGVDREGRSFLPKIFTTERVSFAHRTRMFLRDHPRGAVRNLQQALRCGCRNLEEALNRFVWLRLARELGETTCTVRSGWQGVRLYAWLQGIEVSRWLNNLVNEGKLPLSPRDSSSR